MAEVDWLAKEEIITRAIVLPEVENFDLNKATLSAGIDGYSSDGLYIK